MPIQGYLWTPEEIEGSALSQYSKKFFALIDFCGVVFLESEPTHQTDFSILLKTNSHLGWVCGGTIVPLSIREAPIFQYDESSTSQLFPLVLTVQSDDCQKDVVLCPEDEHSRTMWNSEISRLITTLAFVRSCADHDLLPFPDLCAVLDRISKTGELATSGLLIPSKFVSLVRQELKSPSGILPRGISSSLRILKLVDAQLSDGHATGLAAVLSLTPKLTELDLSHNLLSSKGIKILCGSMTKCTALEILNLSSNYISDSASTALTDLLRQTANLRSLSISRNCFSASSTKIFSTRLGNHNSRLQVIDFSYNEFGDDIGLLIAFLMRNVPPRLKSVDLSYCGLRDTSIMEISKSVIGCTTLEYLNLAGSFIEPETARGLVSSMAHVLPKQGVHQAKMLLKLAGIRVTEGIQVMSFLSLKSAFLGLPESTRLLDVFLRRVDNLEKKMNIFCFHLGVSECFHGMDHLTAAISNRLKISTTGLRIVSKSLGAGGNDYLFASFENDSVAQQLTFDAKESHPALRQLNIKSIYGSFVSRNESDKASVLSITSAGYGGRGLFDCYLPPVSASNQYSNNLLVELSGDMRDDQGPFDFTAWSDQFPVFDDPALLDTDETAQHQQPESPKEYTNLVEYENTVRDRKLVNERLILAVRRLYQAKEISSQVAKFWEGMFGNKKYRKFAEVELVKAMKGGHERLNKNEKIVTLGLAHLFPSVAVREMLYQAMYARDVSEINSIQAELNTVTGGYALVYATRLSAEVAGLKQEFASLKVLATNYTELPLIEDFLFACGKLAYTGEEMFAAVEIRQRLYEQGMLKGGRVFQETASLIKARAVLTNLLISRNMQGLRDTLHQWRLSNELDTSSLPEITIAENIQQEYQNSIANLKSAISKRDIELIDLSLSIASYFNFFSATVEQCVTILNECASNPAVLMRPIIHGLRTSKISDVDKGFDALLKMGLVHEALDAVVCSKVHATKARIIQDDSVRDKLVKVCLALKNGFHVPPGEIMQLYRKSNAIKLNEDPSLKGYFKILQKYSRKFVNLQKQEKVIQSLIADNDVYKLSKLLAGRGTGKLIMSFPTEFARDQWYSKFTVVCSGQVLGSATRIEEKDFKEDLVFQGTFKKAARATDGNLRGWKKRFFLLKTVHLSYFNKPNGDKKGSIRVLNGEIRVIESTAIEGHPYCLELEEGRDLSCVSPDLLEEARRHVRLAKILEIERTLKRGIEIRSVVLLTKMLQFATELEVMLDYNLMNQAKTCLQELQVSKLKKDLYMASVSLPRSQVLQELSIAADKYMVDPNLSSLKKVRSLLGKTEIEQEIYRAKAALVHRNHAGFVRCIKTLSKVDLTQGSTGLKSLYAALFLQFVGIRIADFVVLGYPMGGFSRLLKSSLLLCTGYHIELEVMDLVRVVLKLTSRLTPDLGAATDLAGGGGGSNASSFLGSPQDLQGVLDEILSFPRVIQQYSISKFHRLRVSSVQKRSGMLNAFSRRRSSVMDEVMSFSSTGIAKSLLKYEVEPLDAAIATEAFTVLQVIMGDLNANQLKSWKKSKILLSTPTVGSLVYDMLHLALKRYTKINDELFFQVSKQLKLNPSSASRMRGLCLLSIYLHFFVPSREALPYLKTNILQTKQELSEKTAGQGEAGIGGDIFNERRSLQAAEYCYSLLVNLECSVGHPSRDSALMSSVFNDNSAPVSRLTEVVFAKATTFPFHVLLMTGELVTFRLHYSELTLQNVLKRLFEVLYPAEIRGVNIKKRQVLLNSKDTGEDVELFNEYGQRSASPSPFPNTAKPAGSETTELTEEELWREISYFFDGFAFYSLAEEDLEKSRNAVDYMSIPIQPVYRQLISWNEDIQWKFLENSIQDDFDYESDAVQLHHYNTVVLRRYMPTTVELLSDFEIFGKEIHLTDQLQRSSAWSDWLSNDHRSTATLQKEDDLLPKDFLRIDLLFSEDSRYVNSQLALLSRESFQYLLSLQLALAWIDEPNAVRDRDCEYSSFECKKHRSIFSHCSSSVRSCYLSSVDHVVDKLAENYRLLEEQRKREAEMQGKEQIVEQKAAGSDDSDDDDGVLAAIDGHHHFTGQHHHHHNDDDSSYASTIDDESEEEVRAQWKPTLLSKDEEMGEEDRAFLLSLLNEIGIAPDEPAADLDALWSQMRQFHGIVGELGLSLKSPRYRYYMKRAYHHYLMTATGPMYEQYLVDAKLVSLQLDESIMNEYAEFQENYVEKFEKMDVLIGLSVQGLYLLSPSDWSIVFYSPFWDIAEYELLSSRSSSTTRKELLININGLKLLFKGSKMEEVLSMITLYAKDALRKGNFPFGTVNNYDELLVFNSYRDNPVTKGGSGSGSIGYGNNSLLQQYLANFALLPLPPKINTRTVFKHPQFFHAPSSHREIIASSRYEEEKLEEEIMKLAEQMLLEKNQQQITQGRNEMMTKNEKLGVEEEEEDKEDDQAPSQGTAERRNTNLNRNVKLKRKNRSIFQGNRLKSNEEIFKATLKDRLDSIVCGVSNKESNFTQQFIIPPLPCRVKGKIKVPQTAQLEGKEDDQNNPLNRMRGFQTKPTIASQNFPFITDRSTGGRNLEEAVPVLWAGVDFPAQPAIVKPAIEAKKPDLKHEIEMVWKSQRKDYLSLVQNDAGKNRKSEQFPDVNLDRCDPADNRRDPYFLGLSTVLRDGGNRQGFYDERMSSGFASQMNENPLQEEGNLSSAKIEI